MISKRWSGIQSPREECQQEVEDKGSPGTVAQESKISKINHKESLKYEGRLLTWVDDKLANECQSLWLDYL